MNENLKNLWKRYTESDDHQAREELILHYAGLVKYVVGRLAIRIPPSLQQEDLIAFGILGLIEAISRFDLARGVKFETYAMSRIRGQIIDSLRRMNLLPRSVHRHTKAITQAIAHLSQVLGRIPEDREVAKYLEISLEQYHNWLVDANFVIVSLDQPVRFDDGEQSTLYDALEDPNTSTPSEEVDDKEVRLELIGAIQSLTEREQLVISLYYIDRLTMREIGEVLGISESRVSQIHAKAILILRGLLETSLEPNQISYERQKAYVPIYATAS